MANNKTGVENNPLRQLPSVDELLQQLGGETERWGRASLTTTLRDILSDLRGTLSRGSTADSSIANNPVSGR
jgi:predicted component of type VI protein secretion system